ncbi:MAG: PqqD family peptide modification chaperone [Bryobacterales bacterium]|nr:PqqD family peptide modification chaperone [Bryobacterales bacterium]
MDDRIPVPAAKPCPADSKRLKVCLVGKYPPIQGGVSATMYWTARRLARRGHRVWVVTNASDVGAEYRMHLGPEDAEWMEPRFGPCGGSVSVHPIAAYDPRRMAHIPQTQAAVSRIAAATARVIEENGCDVCFAYYTEPYGVACHVAHLWTGVPYVIRHAGSDIDRLMLIPELSETYQRVFRSAAAVLTRTDLASRFLRMGVERSRIVTRIGFEIPDIFSPSQEPLDLASILSAANREAFQHIPKDLARHDPPDPSIVSIGLYGKVGEAKGSFDLIPVLKILKQQGVDFNFLCMANGTQFPAFLKALRAAGLSDRTWLLPFLPHWHVPAFIAACDAVCFLERDFPITIHGPIIPREVMSCGRCLIVSREIEKKQRDLLDLRDGHNVLVVDDPRNRESLVRIIRTIATDVSLATRIGRNAGQQFQGQSRTDNSMKEFERLLTAATEERVPEANHAAGGWSTEPKSDSIIPAEIRSLFPLSDRLISTHGNQLWRDFERRNNCPDDQSDVITSIMFIRHLMDHFMMSEIGTTDVPEYIVDVLSLERTVLESSELVRQGKSLVLGRRLDETFDFGITDVFDRIRPHKRLGCALCNMQIDLSKLREIMHQGEEIPLRLPAVEQSILVVPYPNYRVRLFRISRQGGALLELCDGRRSVHEIVGHFQRLSDLSCEDVVLESIRRAISDLLQKGILVAT